MQLAIVADWLPVYGGAEHVIAEFQALWPKAPLYTTIANPAKLGPLATADIHTTYLQHIYKLTGKYQWLLPWMPRAIETIDLSAYDTVLTSSHAIAKGIVPPSHARHICYCHTPMRYAWEMEDQYLQDFNVPKFLRRIIKDKLREIRRWDLTTAKRVDTFIANSTTIQERIQRTYNRDAIVITPPVSNHFFEPKLPQTCGEYYLTIGRLVPYKRYDLMIEAANALKLPLKVAGTGQDMERLKKLAGPTVEFLGFVPDEQLFDLYANAKALLFGAFEDAGVVPIEAQACGTPVICFGKGGVLDTVVDEKTGVYFAEQKLEAVSAAIQKFEAMCLAPEGIREHAKQFSSENFRKKILEVV